MKPIYRIKVYVKGQDKGEPVSLSGPYMRPDGSEIAPNDRSRTEEFGRVLAERKDFDRIVITEERPILEIPAGGSKT